MARVGRAEAGQDDRAGDAPRSIQSVEVGFRLIRALEAASGPMTLKDLAAAADMAASRAYLYLVSFRRVGLVAQDAESGRYGLGSYALQLGLTALRRLDLTRHSGETLRALSEATQKAVYLAVWGNHGPCIVQRVDGPGPQPMSLQVGYVLPALSTATGRVFLAYLPSARYDPILERERRFASTRLPSPADMERTRSEVRARGIAHTDGQLNVGFSALSAPIFDHAGEIAAALTAIGPTPTFDDSLEGSTALKLRDAAARLSRTLGWLEGTEPSDAAVSKRGWRSDEGDGAGRAAGLKTAPARRMGSGEQRNVKPM